MKAVVLVDCFINESPAKSGDVVEVCRNTHRNLIRDGKLGEHKPESDEIQNREDSIKLNKRTK